MQSRREGVEEVWWPPRSSKPLRPDSVGSGGFDSHTLPPRARLALAAALLLFVAGTIGAQPPVSRPDTLPPPVPGVPRTLPPRPERDTLITQADTVVSRPVTAIARPPISPRRAFLYSLLVPGLGQAKLDRGQAGAVFVGVEAVALALAAKSGKALDAARASRDSVIVRYIIPAGGGDPEPVYEVPELGRRIASRRTQIEDWIAVLVFNHLFSGADAFVAAQLWDLPEVLAGREHGRTRLGLRVRW